MKNVILFASGGGSNVQAILDYFRGNDKVHFPLIVCNKAHAGVLDIAEHEGIDFLLIDKSIFTSEVFLDNLEAYQADLIVLAGFLWKIPDFLIQAYERKIINIHPALLPNYGGKGMYGSNVHKAVIENKEKESGITIHIVNEEYDKGTILLQKKVIVAEYDTPTTLAEKVLALEHQWFAKVIESLI